MRFPAKVAIVAGVVWLIGVAPALAWLEGGATWEGDPWDCTACHFGELPFPDRQGPHGNYTTTSQKCRACHGVHDTDGGIFLLPKLTIRDNCMVCHDGTGGLGVYGTIAFRGFAVGAAHRIDTTNTVPGGDSSTGGPATRTFGGENDFLSCDDCHSPHGAGTVTPFSGERPRFHVTDLGWLPAWPSSHLLKKRPTGAAEDVGEYGSDWCAACHAGRSSGLSEVHNHPVDSSLTHATPFKYDRVAAVKTDTSLETTYASLGLQIASPLSASTWSNRGFVMPYPRTAEQSGHKPICQQCHEDERVVGEPGAVVSAQIYRYGDGRTSGDPGTDNPLFQTFPHEGLNARFLVETEDSLCLNCHPEGQLP